MTTKSLISQTPQLIITLEENAVASEIRKALKMIRGVASVRMSRAKDDRHVTPALRRSIQKAREESASGDTIVCNNIDEMQQYFDSL